MSQQKFEVGTLVKVKSRAKTDDNRERAREETYGTINSVFEVTAYSPPFEIQGDISPAAYWLTPVGKQHSAFCMYEDELFAARGKIAKVIATAVKADELDLSVPDVSLD